MFERADNTPRARSDDLIVERLPGETLVYDEARDTAHCLPDVVATVFELCDGTRARSTLAALATERLGRPVDSEELDAVLDELHANSLLTEEAGAEGISRRRALVAGGGVVAASLITTIVAPVPAAAQSPGGGPGPGDPGQRCTTPRECDQGLRCENEECCVPPFNEGGGNCSTSSDCCGTSTQCVMGPQEETGLVCMDTS